MTLGQRCSGWARADAGLPGLSTQSGLRWLNERIDRPTKQAYVNERSDRKWA